MTDTSHDKIRVMLVDDSAVVRGMMTKILIEMKDVQIVKSVADGQQALNSIADILPDILILDVEMPNMDGMTALPQLLKKSPGTRVVMCSTLTLRNAQITLEALRLGATDCIAKPLSPSDIKEGGDFHRSLTNIIRGLGKSIPREQLKSPEERPKAALASDKPISLNTNPLSYKGKPSLIAIGSSTGGPQALFQVISHLKDLPAPIVLTQHMPATFTKILANHISQHTGVTAVEAENGMPIENGIVYVAAGGFHMVLEKNTSGHVVTKLDNGAPENFCKPAVDPMIRSAVSLYGNKVLGVILTGMGHDGLESCRKLVETGGRVIAQDKATSIVWGMPGAVAEAGICSDVIPLKDIGPWIRKAVTG